MISTWTTLKVLLKKNFLVRKKHWVMFLIVQVIIPISIIMLLQLIRVPFDDRVYFRSNKGNEFHSSMTSEYFKRNEQMELRFTPRSSVTLKLMEYIGKCLILESEHIIGYPDEATMIEDINLQGGRIPNVGIVFETIVNNSLPKILKYKLRSTNSYSRELFSLGDISNDAQFYMRGNINFAQIQICVDTAYIDLMTNNRPRYNATLLFQQMPHPPYEKLDLNTKMVNFYTLFLGFILVIVTSVESSFPANEKYVGASILMAIHGVKHQMNLFSWLLTGALCSIFYLTPVVMILKFLTFTTIAHIDTVPTTLELGNWLILWLALFALILHVLCFGYHLSSYLRKPLYRSAFAFLGLIITPFFNFFFVGLDTKRFELYFGMLCSPYFLLKLIVTEIMAYEARRTGINWSDIFKPGVPGNTFEGSIGGIMILSSIGAALHFLMAVYINAIRPGKYGNPRPLTFFLQMWKKDNKSPKVSEKFNPIDQECNIVPENNLEPVVQIKNLKKTYTRGLLKKKSVRPLQGVSINFHKNEITALLGYNGAGKTTMLAILSGLTTSSEGVVLVNGEDIKKNPQTIRSNVGFCPQENIVLPDMNVRQQLMFFGSLRQRTGTTKQLESEIEILLSKMNLIDKKNSLPNELSGGQLRKLCFAISIIQDANVLICDEPTSGIDLEGRREIWKILLKLREQKTIVISTHDMEEANILGDRIAVMHDGKLKTYGTPKSLKNLHTVNRIKVILFTEPSCELSEVSREIGIPISVLDEDEEKIVIEIPQTEQLPETLDKLESLKQTLKITGINVSSITLDQVFLNIAEENADNIKENNNEIVKFDKITGFSLFKQTFSGYLCKKLAYARNNPWTFWISLLLPSLSVVLLLAFKNDPIGEPIEFSMNMYSPTETFVQSSSLSLTEMFDKTITDHGGKVIILKPEVTVRQALLNFAADNGIKNYKKKHIVSAEFNVTEKNIELTGFFSGSAIQSLPITINCLTNTLLKDLSNDKNLEIRTSSQRSLEGWKLPEYDQLYLLFATLCLIFFLVPAVSLYVIQPVQENLSGMKKLQNMTGASKILYWVSNFLLDFLQYVVSIFLFMIILILVDKILGRNFYQEQEIKFCLMQFFFFGISILPFLYMTSFLRLSVFTIMIVSTLLPIIIPVVSFILEILKVTVNTEAYDLVYTILLHSFQCIPQIDLLYGMRSFYKEVPRNSRCRRMTDRVLAVVCSNIKNREPCCKMNCSDGFCKEPISYFDTHWTQIKYYVASFCISTLIIFILEQQIMTRIRIRLMSKSRRTNKVEMDEFIREEKAIIDEEIKKRHLPNEKKEKVHTENVLLVQDLKKNQGKLKVVKHISFRVKKGECLGLLGENGAGKSSTLRMLTGIDIPHGGTMYLNNFGIHTDRKRFLAEIGYCPQQNSLIDSFDARDHLYLIAKLRGVPNFLIDSVVEMWIRKLDLTDCAAQPSKTYSGGNKRRLCIAIALIGNPSLVLMDESTSGVDPVTIESLRKIFKSCQDNGQSIILTSQHMKECETYCNRLIIMESGRFTCVGSVQELKQRYRIGFSIHVKLSRTRSNYDLEQIKSRIEADLDCKKVDENSDFLAYHVTDAGTTWKSMYTTMTSLKYDFNCIEDFAIASSSLEQLFLQFGRASTNQENENISKHRCVV